ncbi:MAG: 30S ribosomal protein S17 [SAR202 cluster bacterium]|nr:30S ribosomal protein S17 [SAR202 cluster bacterium]
MSFERRKVRVGTVVSDKMEKTVVVEVEWRRVHPVYKKAVRRRTRFKAHDEAKISKTGDVVRIRETRPLSKTKRWSVVEVVTAGDIAEIQPDELGVPQEQPVEATTTTPEGAAKA